MANLDNVELLSTDFFFMNLDENNNTLIIDEKNNGFINNDTETELNTGLNVLITKPDNINKDKLNMKINSIDHPYIFTKIKHLYNYIKYNSIKENNFLVFSLKKDGYTVTIKMYTVKNILNYILTYQIIYYIDE
jgi:hypothetical protein